MFTHIDLILYPKHCEVIELTSQHYIYTIFKNGQTSLREQAKRNKSKILINQQINKCDKIEIFLRNPKDRFLSGVNTYINHVLRDNPTLDIETIKFFIVNYFCLNRHYLPQFLWLSHLASFTNENCILNLRKTDDIKFVTNFTSNDLTKSNYMTPELSDTLLNDNIISDYLKIDEYLYQLAPSDILWTDIKAQIKHNFSNTWKNIIDHRLRLANVLS
jgi:hypothetical protein